MQVTGLDPDASDPLRLFVFVDREGDFSYYVLRLVHAGIDPQRGEARFSFKAGCPSHFDCRVPVVCEPPALSEPALDYLAKDYQSFRRLMVDLIALRNPSWQERLPADLGMTLVELLAYAGDYLSYRQDAGPGTESYLDTCLHRISAARHARLIDYRMHNGRNAFTYRPFPRRRRDRRGGARRLRTRYADRHGADRGDRAAWAGAARHRRFRC